MKKIIAMLIAAIMAILCVGASAEAGMANPWTDTTADQAKADLGYDFEIPEDADADSVTCRVNAELGMVECTFTMDGAEYCFRMATSAVTDGIEDISGMNYEWELTESDHVGDLDATLMQAQDGENTVEVVIWQDVVPGFAYSLSTVQPDVDGLDLAAIASMMYVPMQGEA